MSTANKVKPATNAGRGDTKLYSAPRQDPREVKKLHIFCARGVKLCKSKGIKVLKIPPKWAAIAAKQGVKQIEGVTLAQ